MKTIPIARPGAGPEPTTNASVQAANERRAAVVAKIEALRSGTGEQPQAQHAQSPIPTNPNQVSAEEMGSVRLQNDTPVEESHTSTEPVGVTTEEVREASKPAESKIETETQLSNSQMAILARKERALRAKAQQQEQAIKAERETWQQEKARLEQRLQELETGYIPKSQLKAEAMELVRRGELSYDEITQEVMNPTDPRITSYISRLEKQVTDLQQKFEKASQSSQEAQTAQYQAAIKQIETDVKNLVKVDPSYEMIKHTNSVRDVVELIEETFKQDGYVMTVEEAAQQVEDYLVEEASKLARVEKIKKRLAPAASVKKEANEQQNADTNKNKQPQPMKTLTNAAGSTRKLSGKERAILAFNGQLKS